LKHSVELLDVKHKESWSTCYASCNFIERDVISFSGMALNTHTFRKSVYINMALLKSGAQNLM